MADTNVFIREIELDLTEPQSDYLVEVKGSVVINLTPTKRVYVKLDSKTNYPVDLSYIVKLTNASYERLYFSWEKQEGKARLLVGSYFDADITLYRFDTLRERLEELSRGTLNLISLKTQELTSQIAQLQTTFTTYLNAIQADISELRLYKADIAEVQSLFAQIQTLEGNFASFQNLYTQTINAINANISSLSTYKADISWVSASYAYILNLITSSVQSLNARIDELSARKITADLIEAHTIRAEHLEVGFVSSIEEIKNIITSNFLTPIYEYTFTKNDYLNGTFYNTFFYESVDIMGIKPMTQVVWDQEGINWNAPNIKWNLSVSSASWESPTFEIQPTYGNVRLYFYAPYTVNGVKIYASVYNGSTWSQYDELKLLPIGDIYTATSSFYERIEKVRIKIVYTTNTIASVYNIKLAICQIRAVGNDWGNIPLANGELSVGLNADMVDGYHVGNNAGQIPVSNGTVCVNLNADMVDGKHASDFVQTSQFTSSNIVTMLQQHQTQPLPLNVQQLSGRTAGNNDGNIPISNGTRCVNLNADLVDGYHVGNNAEQIPVSNGTVCANLNADMLDGKHASDFVERAQYTRDFFVLNTRARRLTRRTHIVRMLGNWSGTYKYPGGVYVPFNQSLYCVPYDATQVLVLRSDLSTTQFGNLSGTAKWIYGCLAKDGKIYCSPRNATQILVIDPLTNTTSLIGNFSGSTPRWRGCVAVDNWVIFLPGVASNGILKYNTSTSQFETVSTTYEGSHVACVDPQGNVWFGVDQIVRFNPFTNQQTMVVSTLPNRMGSAFYYNGKIIFCPFEVLSNARTSFLIYDLTTQQYYTKTFILPSETASRTMAGGALGPDGRIYVGIDLLNYVLIFDPESETLEYIRVGTPGDPQWYSLTRFNSLVVSVPYINNAFLLILPFDETYPSL